MPVSVKSDPHNDLTVFTASGVLTFDEVMETLREFYDAYPTRKVLWDLRAVTVQSITADELRQAVSFIKLHEDKRPQGRTALVGSTDLDSGLSRMGDAFADAGGIPWKIRVFRSMEEAMKWLGE